MQLTVKDIAKLLNVNEKIIYQWIEKAGLPASRHEGQYRINKSLLLEWATKKEIDFVPGDFFEQHEKVALPSVTESLGAGGIFYGIKGDDKQSVIRSVVDLLPLPESLDREFVFMGLWAREQLQSTSVGNGIAFPHMRNPLILNTERPMISLGFLANPIDFDALDGQPVKVLFTLITPTVDVHLHLLSHLAFVCRDAHFRDALDRQTNSEELLNTCQTAERLIKCSSPKKGA